MQQRIPYSSTKVNLSLFYGRGDLIAELISGLIKGESFVLYGGRRMGKTSFIMKMLEEMASSEAQWAQGGVRLLVGQLDILTLESLTSTDIWRAWTESLIATRGHNRVNLPAINASQMTYQRFVDWLREVVAADTFAESLFILIVDDYDRLLPQPWEEGFRSNLTALLSNTPGVSERTSLVLTGDHHISRIKTGPASNLGTLLKWRRLVGLDPEATQVLMEEPCGVPWPRELAQWVWRETLGHPCLVQEWMRQAMSQTEWPHPTAVEAPRSAVANSMDVVFERWWDRLDGTARDIYGLILNSPLPFHADSASDFFGYRAFDEGLDALGATGLVWTTDDEPTTVIQVGGIFSDWYRARGARRLERDELLDGSDRLLNQLEVRLRKWVIQRLDEKYGNGFDFISRQFGNLATVWVDRAREAHHAEPELTSDLIRYSDLGHLFDIILSQWDVFGSALKWSPGSDKGAARRNKTIMEERKLRIVTFRNARKHNRREDISLDECVLVASYCRDLIQRV